MEKYIFISNFRGKERELANKILIVITTIVGLICALDVLGYIYGAFIKYTEEGYSFIATLSALVISVSKCCLWVNIFDGISDCLLLKEKDYKLGEDNRIYVYAWLLLCCIQCGALFVLGYPSDEKVLQLGWVIIRDELSQYIYAVAAPVIVYVVANFLKTKFEEKAISETKDKFEETKVIILEFMDYICEVIDKKNKRNAEGGNVKYCTNCGKPVEANWNNCNSCGHEIKK